MLGELNKRITVYQYVDTVLDGYPVPMLNATFEVWANVQNRSGRNIQVGGQNLWTYDYKMTVRYNSNFQPNNIVGYDGKTMKIESISKVTEGFAEFMELRCSCIDDAISYNILVAGTVYRYDFTAVGGEFEFTNTDIINKRIISVNKDGIGFGEIITSGDPENKQVKYVASEGKFVFAIPFEPTEKAFVLWQMV